MVSLDRNTSGQGYMYANILKSSKYFHISLNKGQHSYLFKNWWKKLGNRTYEVCIFINFYVFYMVL